MLDETCSYNETSKKRRNTELQFVERVADVKEFCRHFMAENENSKIISNYQDIADLLLDKNKIQFLLVDVDLFERQYGKEQLLDALVKMRKYQKISCQLLISRYHFSSWKTYFQIDGITLYERGEEVESVLPDWWNSEIRKSLLLNDKWCKLSGDQKRLGKAFCYQAKSTCF